MLFGARQYMERRGKRLPYDAELEWLQGDGACGLWIPCDVNNGKFEVSYYRTSLQTQYLVRQARRSYETRLYDLTIAHSRNSDTLSRGVITSWHMKNQNASQAFGEWFSGSAQLAKKFTAVIDIPNATNTFSTGGGGEWTPATFDSLPFVGLLCTARSSNVTVDYSTAKICSFKIWERGVLVRDFIPTRKGGVGLFFDRVSGAHWPVSGTGAFVIGTDIAGGGYKCLRLLPFSRLRLRFSRLWKEAA